VVLHLLSAVQAKYGRLTDRFTKSKAVWKEVASEMQAEMPGVTDSQCNQMAKFEKNRKSMLMGRKRRHMGKAKASIL